MAEYNKGASERIRATERKRLDGICQTAKETFGFDLGTTYFEYAHGRSIDSNRPFSENEEKRDWSGIQMQFARAVINVFEAGTTEEKVLALVTILKAFEVRINEVRGEIPSSVGGIAIYK